MKAIFKNGIIKDLHYSIANKLIRAGECQPLNEESKKINEELGIVKEPIKRGRKKVK